MKKTMILAAFAALISLASCQKEEVIDNGTDKNASPVFTASIAGATKTTIGVTDGKVAWETTDEITVTDAAKNSATYTIESVDATTGKATFVLKTGETALGDGPYTATYGTAPATAQTYCATAGKLYMTAPETSNNSFTFTVQCGLMKLNLTKSGESVKSIAVTGTPTGGSENTYTLTCTEAQSIASAKDFFIALPAGSYTKIEITNAEDVTCTLNSTNGVAVAANHIKPVTFGADKLNFAPAVPDGALSGVFSVSDTKKVYFSKGNLYWDGDSFEFETNQYDYPSSWDINHVGHFYWNADAASARAETWNTLNATSFFTSESGFTVNGQTGIWYTLSSDEWVYLIEDNSVWSTINGVNGLIIFCDGYVGEKDNLTEIPENCIFLPAAGNRTALNKFDYAELIGTYWSSSPVNKTKITMSYSLAFDYDYEWEEGSVIGDDSWNQSVGMCVRLVTNCN